MPLNKKHSAVTLNTWGKPELTRLASRLLKDAAHFYLRNSFRPDTFEAFNNWFWHCHEYNLEGYAVPRIKEVAASGELVGVSVDACFQLAVDPKVTGVTIFSLSDELLCLQFPFFIYMFTICPSLYALNDFLHKIIAMDDQAFKTFMESLWKDGPFETETLPAEIINGPHGFKYFVSTLKPLLAYQGKTWMRDEASYTQVRQLVLGSKIRVVKQNILEPATWSTELKQCLFKKAATLFLSNITLGGHWATKRSIAEIAQCLEPLKGSGTCVIHSAPDTHTAVFQTWPKFALGLVSKASLTEALKGDPSYGDLQKFVSRSHAIFLI